MDTYNLRRSKYFGSVDISPAERKRAVVGEGDEKLSFADILIVLDLGGVITSSVG